MTETRQPSTETVTWWTLYNAALTAGLSDQEAVIFATGDGSLAELQKLVDGGCPTTLIARIVL